jgi:hypothetical protein
MNHKILKEDDKIFKMRRLRNKYKKKFIQGTKLIINDISE